MEWKCPNCNRLARLRDNFRRVRCPCGLVQSADGETWMAFKGPTYHSEADPIQLSPEERLLYENRLQACVSCDSCTGEYRCREIDEGCKRSFIAALTAGKCPRGKWRES